MARVGKLLRCVGYRPNWLGAKASKNGIAKIRPGPKIKSFIALNLDLGDFTLLTEAEVERTFRKLLKSEPFSQELFDRGEELLEQLRPESPLRHRLSSELEELREISLLSS